MKRFSGILFLLFFNGNIAFLSAQENNRLFREETLRVSNSNQSITDGTDAFSVSGDMKVVGYVPNWIDLNAFSKTFDFSKLTHINIAFENPDANGNLSYNQGNSAIITKAHANGVQVLVSIGGGSESEDAATRARYFSLISNANRAAFISKIASYITARNFDGIDVDLEGPAINADYGDFIKDLSDSLKPMGKLVTAALSQGYGGASVQNATLQYFDFVNVMSYNATGSWDKNSPGQHSSFALADADIKNWKGRGLPAEKIILGVPFYGYGFGAAYRDYDYSYSEIVKNYTGAENKDQVGSTLYYNGIHTIKRKTILAMQQAGGIMIWELSSDATGPKSLLLAIDQVIQGTDTLPVEPGSLVATAISVSQINLTWTDNSNNETSFRVERSLDSIAGWTYIASVGLDVRTYSNTGLSPNTQYYFRVRAENFTGNSAYSNIFSAITPIDATGIPNPEQEIPVFSMFPNPASVSTNIEYVLSENANVRLDIFGIEGQIVQTLIYCERQATGFYHQTFNISDLNDGIYFVRFTSGNYTKTVKLIIKKES